MSDFKYDARNDTEIKLVSVKKCLQKTILVFLEYVILDEGKIPVFTDFYLPPSLFLSPCQSLKDGLCKQREREAAVSGDYRLLYIFVSVEDFFFSDLTLQVVL